MPRRARLSNHASSAGTVPGSLGDLQQLIVLDLSSNQFSGALSDFAIQTSIGDNNLNSVLRFFSAANNSLSGEGPLLHYLLPCKACCVPVTHGKQLAVTHRSHMA